MFNENNYFAYHIRTLSSHLSSSGTSVRMASNQKGTT